jgi:beta-lactamase class A
MLSTSLKPILDKLGGQVACLVSRVEEAGPRVLFSLNPETVFPAASLAKVPILLEVARQLAQHDSPYTWQTRLEVTAEARVPSAGVLSNLSPELRPTLYDLAHLMITISDNTAANMLLDLVGMEAVNATMRNIGLLNTRLERRFMDFEARQAGRDNWTTAADIARLFCYLCGANVPERQRLLQILLHQNDYAILPAYWGEETLFAHKTGGLPGLMHDAGLLFRGLDDPHPLVIVTLTAEQEDIPLTQFRLARLGRAIRQECQTEP